MFSPSHTHTNTSREHSGQVLPPLCLSYEEVWTASTFLLQLPLRQAIIAICPSIEKDTGEEPHPVVVKLLAR